MIRRCPEWARWLPTAANPGAVPSARAAEPVGEPVTVAEPAAEPPGVRIIRVP